ncbi:MAG: tripartite tricarboxylate transporter substrate binding protein [Burkholderiales bacterium]
MSRIVHAVALALLALSCLPAAAQPWPSKPIKLIVPYPPGGGNDTLARLFGQKLGERLGQPIVIENKPGAGTLIGTEAAAKSPGDGYTWLLSSVTTHALAPALYPNVRYDPIKDFAPVTILGVAPTVIVVNKDFPANTLQEFVAEVRRNPGKYAFASGGLGTTPHIAGEIFKSQNGLDLLHVPYKGGGPAIADLIGGRVQVMFDTAASAMPHVRAGKLKALAIAAPGRQPDYPDLPTAAEVGFPNYRVDSWYSLHVPAGTPPQDVKRIWEEVLWALEQSDVKERLKALYAEPGGMSPEEFAKYQKVELDRYTKIIKEAGIKAE